MKKSTLLTIVALVLALAMGVSGTMAYLSDTDDDVNVMTLGNVDIEQIELERDEEGNLQNFTQNKDMYPAVGTYAWDPELVYWPDVSNTASSPVFDDEKLANVVDKFVFVENTGKSDAYVRTIFAFEVGEYDFNTVIGDKTNPNPLVHINNNDKKTSETEKGHWDWTWFETPVTIDGNKYVLAEALYLGASSKQGTAEEGILVPGATSYPSLLQLFLDPSATNEDMVKLDGNANGTYDVLVVSQAVQTAGFANAEAALNAAFGEVTANSHPWMTEANGGQPPYIDSPVFPGMVTNNEELATAIAEAVNAEGETEIRLASGTYEEPIRIPGGSDLTIVGNGAKTVINDQIATTSSEEGVITLKNLTINVDNVTDQTGISQTGKSGIAIWGNQTVICENVTFNMTQANSTAITSWWDTGVGTTIIVKDCTFNCNGQRPIRATGNVTVENCTFNDPYRYAVQLTAKTSTATLMDKAIINFNNNTIVDGPNGKDFVYGIQLEGADYGCNNCVINGAGNKIVNGGAGSTMYYCECGKVQHETITFNTEVDPVHEN